MKTQARLTRLAIGALLGLAAGSAGLLAQAVPPDYQGSLVCVWCGEPNVGVPGEDSDADRYRNVVLNCVLWGVDDVLVPYDLCRDAQHHLAEQVVFGVINGITFHVCSTNAGENQPCMDVDFLPTFAPASEWLNVSWIDVIPGIPNVNLPGGIVGYRTVAHLPNGTQRSESFLDAYNPPLYPVTPPGLWYPLGHPDYEMNFLALTPTPTPTVPPPTPTRTRTPTPPAPTATKTRTPTSVPPTPTKTRTPTPHPTVPGGGGGGGCFVDNPATSLLHLDGSVDRLDNGLYGLSKPLVRMGRAEDGRLIILNEFEVSERIEGPALTVRYQAEHPHDEHYAPLPRAVFAARPVSVEPATTRSGWVVVLFGKSGKVTSVQLVPADRGAVTRGLIHAVRSGIRIEWADARRHDVNVYVPYRVRGGSVEFRGEGLVSLPGCGKEHCS